VVIENNGTRGDLQDRARDVWRGLEQRALGRD
jgi:hypothetical protein